MSKLQELLNDKNYMTNLVNYTLAKLHKGESFVPVFPDWVDEKVSGEVSEVFRRLLPEDMPYITTILVERNPDTLYDGVCTDGDDKRQRYIIVTVIPDTEYPFNYSYPLIHGMWSLSLYCWEIIRATLAACRKDMQVKINNGPAPLILNNAILERVSLYLGRKPYDGIVQLSQQIIDNEHDDIAEYNVNLFKVREADAEPLLDRLIGAYDADYPETEQHEKKDN